MLAFIYILYIKQASLIISFMHKTLRYYQLKVNGCWVLNTYLFLITDNNCGLSIAYLICIKTGFFPGPMHFTCAILNVHQISFHLNTNIKHCWIKWRHTFLSTIYAIKKPWKCFYTFHNKKGIPFIVPKQVCFSSYAPSLLNGI